MAYTIQLNPTVFTDPLLSPNLYRYKDATSTAFIYVGPQGSNGGMPIYTNVNKPETANNNKFLVVIGTRPAIFEDDAFRRLGIAQWRAQLADLVQRKIIVITDTAGPTVLSVSDVLQLWSRSP